MPLRSPDGSCAQAVQTNPFSSMFQAASFHMPQVGV